MPRTGARWYADHQQAILAAASYTELGDWEAAADVIVDSLHDLEKQGRIPDLADIFAAFPVTWAQRNFRWVFLSAWMLYIGGNITEGLAPVSLASQGARKDQLIVAEYLRASTTTFVSDPRPCLEAVERALVLCDQVGEDCEFEDLIGMSRTADWRALCRGLGLLAGAYLGEWERTAPMDVPLDAAVAVELRPGAMAAARGRRAAHAALAGRSRRSSTRPPPSPRRSRPTTPTPPRRGCRPTSHSPRCTEHGAPSTPCPSYSTRPPGAHVWGTTTTCWRRWPPRGPCSSSTCTSPRARSR